VRQAADRFESLDVVRGVAVMGILLLNIVGFALPESAYFNPRAYGGAQGADLAAYLVNFVLFDGKMRGLFSFLFGASMLLVIERAEAEGRNPAVVHYARMFWLLAFGLAHLWLLWWGDILSHYALVGMIAFAFRKLTVPRLVAWGLCLVLAQFAAMAMLAAAAGGPTDAAGLQQFFGISPPAALASDLALHRGSYEAIVAARFAEHGWSAIDGLWFFGWETLGYMAFGMAAMKSGMLTGAWDRRRYALWAAVGFGIGIPAYVAIALWLVGSDFALFPVVMGVMAVPTLVRPPMIAAWACLILLAMRPGGALTARIGAAGRMAFTNYLATSLICTTLFYGYGLGWYGHLSRAELYLVVPAVWALMLLWSQPWLARFRYGPFEWLWRSLSRGGLQPMRRGPVSGP
jgi:uncharacterized protein